MKQVSFLGQNDQKTVFLVQNYKMSELVSSNEVIIWNLSRYYGLNDEEQKKGVRCF